MDRIAIQLTKIGKKLNSTATNNSFSISLSLQVILTASLAYYGTKYLETGTTIFQSCDIGEIMVTEYSNKQNTSFETVCTKKICTCENGSAATGIFCWEHLENGCADCEAGFYKQLIKIGENQTKNGQIEEIKEINAILPKTYSCELIKCTCSNGIPKFGQNCFKHGQKSCDSCNINYQLVENSPFIFECSKDVECSCPAGEVLTNSSCTNSFPEKCASCKPFYHLNVSQCEINTCACRNGYPFRGVIFRTITKFKCKKSY